MLLATHVFPEFSSEHGFLRARVSFHMSVNSILLHNRSVNVNRLYPFDVH